MEGGDDAVDLGRLFEVRRYADGLLHIYRVTELDSERELLTPVCADIDAFYGVDHERGLSVRQVRGEDHPACLLAAYRAVPIPSNEQATVVLPTPIGVFRGWLRMP